MSKLIDFSPDPSPTDLDRLSPDGVTQANAAIAKAEQIQEQTIQQQAGEFVPKALKTLGKFSQGLQVNKIKPTAQVVAKSARDIVEIAGGRPETRDPRIGDGSQNLTIVLQRFTDGTTKKIDRSAVIDIDAQPISPIEAAEQLVSSVTRTFEVEDGPDD